MASMALAAASRCAAAAWNSACSSAPRSTPVCGAVIRRASSFSRQRAELAQVVGDGRFGVVDAAPADERAGARSGTVSDVPCLHPAVDLDVDLASQIIEGLAD